MTVLTLNNKRVCGPSKRVHETINEKILWRETSKKSLRTTMRSPALMLAMMQVQQETLAIDGDVDKKQKPKSSRRRWPPTTMSTKKKEKSSADAGNDKSPARMLATMKAQR